MPVRKEDGKGWRVSNFALLFFVFKWHGSEGVKTAIAGSPGCWVMIRHCRNAATRGREREIYGCVWETKQWQCPDNRRDSQRLWHDIWLKMFIIHSFYLAPFSAPQQTHCGLVKCDSEWLTASFYSAFFIFICTEVDYWWRCLVFALLVPRETAAVSAQVLCTPFNRAPVYNV